MDSKTAKLALYAPQQPDMPYLVVSIFPDGKVEGVAAPTEAQARGILEQLAVQVLLPGGERRG